MNNSESEAERTSADLRGGGIDLPGEVAVAISSTTLMNGRREVVILHGGERYRLRLTANDKLILTK